MQWRLLVAEYGINPWELDRLTMRDLQQVAVAERAKQYIQEQQRDRHDSPGQSGTVHGEHRTPKGTPAQQEFTDRWSE